MHKEKFLSGPVLILAGILLLVIFLRLPAVSPQFYILDEADSAVAGKIILDGGVVYRDVPAQRTPVIFYLYALSFALFGGTMASAHLMLLILILLTVTALFLLSRKAWDPKTACWTAFLFAVSSYAYLDADMLAFNVEFIAAFFSVMGALSVVSYVKNRRGIFLALGGVFFGMAFLSKQPAILDFLVALSFIGVAVFAESRSFGRTVKAVSLLMAGFCLPLIAVTFYFYLNNCLPEFYFYCWAYNINYYIPASGLFEKIAPALWFISPKSFLRENLYLLILFIVGAIMAAQKYFSRAGKLGMDSLIEPYFIAWALAAYIGACLGGKTCGHYFIMILPPFCLIGGRCVYMLFNIVNNETRSLQDSSRKYFKVFLIAVITLQLALPVIYYAFKRDVFGYYARSFVAAQSPLPVALRDLTGYIKDNSGKKDKIFVWGYFPEIYGLTERMPASRYWNSNALTGLIPWANAEADIDTSKDIIPGAWKVTIEDLKKNKPVYIIDTSPGGHRAFGKYPISKYKELSDLMDESYRLAKEFYDENGNISFKVFKRR